MKSLRNKLAIGLTALTLGAGIVSTYLTRLPSEEQKRLSKIRIEPEKRNRGVIKLFLGNKGMEIIFERERK